MSRHDVYSQDAKVHLVSGEDKLAALAVAVERAGFLAHLEARWRASGKGKDDFGIAIKPNFKVGS